MVLVFTQFYRKKRKKRKKWLFLRSSLLTCWIIRYLSVLDFSFPPGQLQNNPVWSFYMRNIWLSSTVILLFSLFTLLLHLEKYVSNLATIWALFSFCSFELKLSALMVQTLLWSALTQRSLHHFLSTCLSTHPALEGLDHNFPLPLLRNLTIS